MRDLAMRCRLLTLAIMVSMPMALAGCSGVEKEAKYPTGGAREAQASENDIYKEDPSIFGQGGLNIFGRDEGAEDGGSSGIGVNSYLWRASLDTVSFMPLASADPFGGVILTDWYAPSDKPDERFKLNVFILDRQLRSDGIEVKVFRQVKKGGNWADSPVSEDTSRQLEDAILTRARQLRVAQMGQIGE